MTMLHPHPVGVPAPNPSPESAPYWEGCRIGVLRYQRCDACGRPNFGPGLACRWCHSRELSWVAGSGCGVVYSWTVVWRPQTPAFPVPYAPAIVRLGDGYDILSALIGLDHTEITAGLPVGVEFHPVSEAITLPYFRPRPG